MGKSLVRSPAVAVGEGDEGLTVVGEVGDAVVVEKVGGVFFVDVVGDGLLKQESKLLLVSASHDQRMKELRDSGERSSSDQSQGSRSAAGGTNWTV